MYNSSNIGLVWILFNKSVMKVVYNNTNDIIIIIIIIIIINWKYDNNRW